MKKAVILINKLSDDPAEDERDVIDQADHVENELKSLGYYTSRLFMGLNLEETRRELSHISPSLIFNLVEGLEGNANLIHLAPALLETIHIPFTGCRLESMFITSNKVLTKKILSLNSINTPRFFTGHENFIPDPEKMYIAKPLWEDASVGITDKNVFSGENQEILAGFRKKWNDEFFVEEYIEGREYNVSVLGGESGPEVMPPAEIIFKDFPDNKPRIVGYAAKWDKDAFEYTNTVRTFEFQSSDEPLREKIREMALNCWKAFDLKGYARVDFRVDNNGIPYVLEINANPCLSKDAGFFAACIEGGLTFNAVVQRIIYDAII